MKTYELREVVSVPYIHIYDTYAIACDGEQTIRVYLTKEQIVQIAADVTEIASKILRWEAQNDVQPGKDGQAADSGRVEPRR